MTTHVDAIGQDLAGRLDAAGWGLLFLLSGAVPLLPGLPDGTWLTGVGAILLGLDFVRSRVGLPVSGFWMTLGIGLLGWGVGLIAGLALPWFSMLLILCGLALVIGALDRGSRLA